MAIEIIFFILAALLILAVAVAQYESRRNAVHHKHRGGRDE